MIITQSFAKNMGMYAAQSWHSLHIYQHRVFPRYGERVGAIHFVVSNAAAAANVLSQVKIIVRTNYSSPPCHGARVAGAVLNDPELCTTPPLISASLFCAHQFVPIVQVCNVDGGAYRHGPSYSHHAICARFGSSGLTSSFHAAIMQKQHYATFDPKLLRPTVPLELGRTFPRSRACSRSRA